MSAAAPVPFNLAEHVLAAGTAAPDHVALSVLSPSRADRWSYARLISSVRGTATGLLETGLQPGDRVLLRLGDTPDFPVAFLGAIAAGLVPVPTSAALTRPEITAVATDLAPATLVAGEGITLPDHAVPVIAPDALRAMASLPPAPWHRGDPERPGYIVYTSGTSGRPRGVVHAHRAILARAAMRDGWTGLTPSDRLLHAGAFNWTFTLGTGLLDPWTLGATALIPAPGVTTELLPLLLRRHDATIFAAAPGVFRRMLRAPLPAMPKLRHGLSAGEKLPESTRRAWQDATGTHLHEAYGLSECSTFVSGSPARPAPPGTLGWPQPGRQAALRDGQIAVHRSDPGLMLGYLNAPEDTVARFHGDWFLTGDLALETETGALICEGRADDMLNAGGLRVSPLEIEAAMEAHPAIEEAAACDLALRPDTTVIGLFYTGTPLDETTLSTHAATRLARWKHPRLYIHREALPRSANGKLLRRTLKAHWETAHGQA